MRNIKRFLTPPRNWTFLRQGSRMRLRHWILGLTLFAVLLSCGCPKNDPLEAFNPPNTPNDPGPAPVPEPVTALLFGTALLIGGAIVRRRRSKNHQ
jgi:hypothetical protein